MSLFEAIRRDDLERVKFLITNCGDVNVQDENGITPLIIASERGNLEIVKLLVTVGGANVNHADICGYTPLIWAILRGKFEIVKFLVNEGADINFQNKYNSSAIWCASIWGHLEMVKFLIENGAEIHVICYFISKELLNCLNSSQRLMHA